MKTIPIVVGFALLSILFSCKSSHCAMAKLTGESIPFDSAIHESLGDTICNVLSFPSSVYAYKMCPPKAGKDTLAAAYGVDSIIGKLDISYYAALQFYLKDSTNYILSDDFVKTPFSPNIGFEFVGHKKEKVYLLLAFNGNQLKVLTPERTIWHRQFKNEYFLLKFASLLLPTNEYIRKKLSHI